MKSSSTFLARPFAVLKNHFAAAALFAALMLSVVAAPVPASADEGHHESGVAHIAKKPELGAASDQDAEADCDAAVDEGAPIDSDAAAGQNAVGQDVSASKAGQGAVAPERAAAKEDGAEDAEATQTVTVYHYEMVYYDDPTFEDSGIPELTGLRLIGTSTVEGLKPGDVVDAWDQVGGHPGFAFFDGWPANLTVSEDSSKNAIKLMYYRRASDVTVNYYEATLLNPGSTLPLRSDVTVESIGDQSVGFTKLGSEVRPRELFADVLTGDELAEAAAVKYPVSSEGDDADDAADDGEELAYVGSYPEDVFVSMDTSKNEINLVYTRPVAGPDHIEMESDEVILPDSVPGAAAPGQGSGSEGADDDTTSDGGTEGAGSEPGQSGAEGAGSEPGQSSAEGAGQTGNAGEAGSADVAEGTDASEGGATQVVESGNAATKGHAEAEAAAENGVLTLPQTGDEWGLTFALVLLASALAAVAAAAALRKIRR